MDNNRSQITALISRLVNDISEIDEDQNRLQEKMWKEIDELCSLICMK